MGNYIVHHSSEATGKVILSDGTVYHFDKPLTVAELMLDYPQEVVVEFQSGLAGKRPTPLPADKCLDMKKMYLMLPMKRGKPAPLTSEEARRVILSANSVLRSSRSLLSSSRFLPLLAKTCSVVTGEKQRFVEKEHAEKSPERPSASELLQEIFEVTRPEYLSRQLSGKAWKPNLDTITEKKKKAPHRLLIKWVI